MHVEFVVWNSNDSRFPHMDVVDQRKSTLCDHPGSTHCAGKGHADQRDVVLDRTRQTRHACTLSTHVSQLVSLNFTPHPISFKPQWFEFYKECASRARRIQNGLNSSGLSFLYRNREDWKSYTFISVSPGTPIQSLKLFHVCKTPIPCEFDVQGFRTQGVIEGFEIDSVRPLMRIYLSYRSPWRQKALQTQKAWFTNTMNACGLHNKYLIHAMWMMTFDHPKIAQGYEFTSRLMRFQPNIPNTLTKSYKRPRPWNFRGCYEPLLESITTSQKKTQKKQCTFVQFMTKKARRDRSINHIRLIKPLTL